MSTIDQVGPAGNSLVRPQAGAIAAALAAWTVGLFTGAWQELRESRPLRMGLVWGMTAWIVLQLAFVAWSHHSLEGFSHRAFLPGVIFGVPAREAAAGYQDICQGGYDGQLYYWQSNDLLGRRDAYKHIDNIMYRYQRIGIPMLAGGLSSLLGYELTPPLLYHSLQLAVTSIGFGVLVYWLLSQGLHPAYALGWLLSAGTLQSLCLGVLDAPTDAFFICTMVALLARRMWLYVPMAILLLLTREVYAAFAFTVFMVTVFQKFPWKDVTDHRRQMFFSALPGVVMLAWTAYLTLRFHMSPLEARTNNPNMNSYPFYMMYKYISIFFHAGNWYELRLLLVTAFTFILVTIGMLRNWKRLPLAMACVLPYVLLTACLGRAIWEAHGSSMRVTNTMVVLGIFLMAIDKSMILKFMLALQAIAGVAVEADARLFQPQLLSPYLLHEEHYDANPPDWADNEILSNLNSSVEWVDPQEVCRPDYHGLWSWCHREVKPVQIAVTNNSDVTWQPGLGKHPLWLGYILYDAKNHKRLASHSVILDKPIAPGETEEITAYLEVQRPGKKYEVEFSVWQDGAGWFVRTDPSFGRRYQFTVE